jgi:hypothetical protein
MFWEAIVTTNSGSPRLTRAPASRVGGVNASEGTSSAGAAASTGASAMTTMAAASAPGTAQRRANRISSTHTATTGPTSSGRLTVAWTGARQTGSSTPASIALASAGGIAPTQRPSGRHIPATTISTPEAANAPRAAGYPPGGSPAEISSAAPGVDHAIVSGIR